jgi:hypothetical protein
MSTIETFDEGPIATIIEDVEFTLCPKCIDFSQRGYSEENVTEWFHHICIMYRVTNGEDLDEDSMQSCISVLSMVLIGAEAAKEADQKDG